MLTLRIGIDAASSSFEVKPNGTQPAEVTANTNADPNSSATMAATGSATATLASTTSTGTSRPSGGASNGATTNMGAAAMVGTAASVVLGVGFGLLA